jgi:perosamine synthetase
VIVTNDGDLAARLKRLRHQGMSLSDFERHGAAPTTFETYPEIGYNFRITDVQAAIGLCQLDRLDDLLARRRAVADAYRSALGALAWLDMPFVPNHVTPNWQSFQVRVRPGAPVGRNELMESLHEQGVATRRGVMASHHEAPYRHLNAHLPETDRAAAECLQLPMHAGMTQADVDAVITALQGVSVDRSRVSRRTAR